MTLFIDIIVQCTITKFMFYLFSLLADEHYLECSLLILPYLEHQATFKHTRSYLSTIDNHLR